MTSIILINYNSEELIWNSLKSFIHFHKNDEVEFIIINNGGSLNGLVADELFLHHSIKVIDSGGNIGFSRANNIGLKNAKGTYILYLNADTLFVEPILSPLISQLDQNTSIGLIACQLLNSDLSLQLSYHDGDAIFQKLKLRNPFAIKFFKATQKLKKTQQIIVNAHSKKHNAPWLSGACMLMRKADIEKHRLQWDEDFFMYWEDVELCYRIRKTGFSVMYFPLVKLIHIGGSGDTNVSLSRFTWMENAKLLFIEKSRGYFSRWIYYLWMKWELRLERFLARKQSKLLQNTIFEKEIDFYLNHKR